MELAQELLNSINCYVLTGNTTSLLMYIVRPLQSKTNRSSE